MSAEIRVVNDGQELAGEAAELFVWLGSQTIATGSCFRVALAGGSTPKGLYAALTEPRFSKELNWTNVEFYFGDERCVPPDHPESNFGMANRTLFRPLGIESQRIFRMEGEARPPEEAARRYEATVRAQFDAAPPAWPRFDLILLGLGEDGHTASLFPETPELDERVRLVVATKTPRGVADRLTLTAPAINQARSVIFLVSGSGKAGAVRAVLESPASQGRQPEPLDRKFPARLIRPVDGRVIWFLDRAAASELSLARQGINSHEE
jgi:6-phosphogluconolactonase